jgi:hypothetical protein
MAQLRKRAANKKHPSAVAETRSSHPITTGHRMGGDKDESYTLPVRKLGRDKGKEAHRERQ